MNTQGKGDSNASSLGNSTQIGVSRAGAHAVNSLLHAGIERTTLIKQYHTHWLAVCWCQFVEAVSSEQKPFAYKLISLIWLSLTTSSGS